MPFSQRALSELRDKLQHHHPEAAMRLTEEEIASLATMLATLSAASLKMRLRYRSVGRPLRSTEPLDLHPVQSRLPGLDLDGREGKATGGGR